MNIEVVPIRRLDFRFEPKPWHYAEEHRAEIDAYFAALRKSNPAIYNGRLLLMHRWRLHEGVLQGAYLETDFASYMGWRDHGNPGEPMRNCFAQGALRGSDGGLLLGIMGGHTINAGKIYFPSGTPDPNDIAGDTVDLDASVAREVEEETGLVPSDYRPEPEWTGVFAGPRIALIKTLWLAESAAAARERIRRNLEAQTNRELADMHIVHGPADLSERMPDYIRAYFANFWGGP